MNTASRSSSFAAALVIACAPLACGDDEVVDVVRLPVSLGLTWTLEGEAATLESCPGGSTVNVGTCAAPPGTPDAALAARRDCAAASADFAILLPSGDNCLVARLSDRNGLGLYEEPIALTILVGGQRVDRAVDFDLAGDGGRPGGGTIRGDAGNDTPDADAGADAEPGDAVADVASDAIADAAADVESARPTLIECICGDGAVVLEDCVAGTCTRTGDAPPGSCEALCGERGFSGSTCYRSAPICR
jgi:hypothetical protein